MEISDISDGDSVRLEVEVSSKTNVIKGGHRFFKVSDDQETTVKCAAFEPSKTFRHVIDRLEVGDSLIICGSFKKDTINLEKIRIQKLAKRFSKSANPVCDCGRRTHSSGKGMRYRCKACGKKYDRPEMRETAPNLEIGWYEPPASARRHLTTPVSLMR
jgi:tRNA(Ile2)-agmatinylcytidine synthase